MLVQLAWAPSYTAGTNHVNGWPMSSTMLTWCTLEPSEMTQLGNPLGSCWLYWWPCRFGARDCKRQALVNFRLIPRLR
eukprot:2749712-Amphidinium_carterae.1